MKSKIISLILSIFLVIEPVPVFAAQTSAVQYAETAHSAYNKSDFLKAGQYYEKAYSVEKNKIFIDNACTSYISYAFNLLDKKDYDNAIKYCKKALSLSPDNQNAKELLSDIYSAKNSDNQISPSELTPVSASAPDDIPNLLKLMEMKLYGKAQGNSPVITRVQKLEKDVFNNNYNQDSLITRLDRLKHAVLPELLQKPVNNLSRSQDYIQEIIEQSSGTAKIFGEMPIMVFMEDGDTKTYKKYYKDAIKDAMKEWETASNGKIKFEISNDPMKSNLKIVWNDNFEDFAWQPELKKEDVAAEKQKIKYGKAGTLVQIGSIAAMALGALAGIPAIGMVGSIGGSVASPYLQYKSLDLNDRALSVKISTAATAEMTKEQASERIKQVAMHQLGHAIGIYGHSSNPNDIMYANFSVNKLSDRDKNTINEIYKNVKPEETKKKGLGFLSH